MLHLVSARPSRVLRFLIVAATAFLTLVDLFATQAILPALARAYGVSPATMSFAVNATTIGMAAGGLGVSVFSQFINRRLGIFISLSTLAVPTLLLATLPSLAVFTTLRLVQGLCMSAAFALTLAHLGEQNSQRDTATAFAAYITGNVGSNLIGRLLSAGIADHLGLAANFLTFAVLNLTGAALVWLTIRSMPPTAAQGIHPTRWLVHLRDARLVPAFMVGFCILFAFIGTFTFVNFVLVRPPLSLSMMQIGFVYFVFLPAVFTTPLAGTVVRTVGVRPAAWGGLALSLAGLPLLVVPQLSAVLTGMVLVSTGTFFAQAVATGFVSLAATTDRAGASGLYLACYFTGGLAGSVVLGQIFDRFGWHACVAGIGCALLVAIVLGGLLRTASVASSRLQSIEEMPA
jgi:MFS transporter, YNFM family, putative membrane transport protein